MSLAIIFIVILIVIGFWPLFIESGYQETKLRMPHVITFVRIVFILLTVLLILIYFGAISNKQLT